MCFSYVLISLLVTSSVLCEERNCPVHHRCTCLSQNRTDVKCRNFGTTIPKLAPTDFFFNSLRIDGNNTITTLDESAFAGVRVKALNISRVGISSLECNSFAGLEMSLTELTFIQGNLTEVPACAISTLIKLRRLDLSGNGISALKRNDFVSLSELRALLLRYNGIERIERGAFNGLTFLSYLGLSHNNIVSVDGSWLDPLKSLGSLDLTANSIASIAADSIRHLPRLRKLGVSGNSIEEIPERVFEQNRELRILDISSNKLQRLPANLISKLPKLREFKIRNNPLSVIPEALFRQSSEMERIDFSGCPLQEIQWQHFYGLDRLKYLNLENTVSNGSTVVSPQFNQHWPKLYVLKLRNSGVSQLLPGSIANLPNLVFLGLGKNKLENIPEKLLANCSNLKYIWLYHNRITDIHPSVIENLGSKLEVLRLSHNPLSCSTLMALKNKLSELSPYLKLFLKGVTPCHCFPHLPNIRIYTCGNISEARLEEIYVDRNRSRFLIRWSVKGPTGFNSFQLFYFDLASGNKSPVRNLNPDVRSAVLEDIAPNNSYNVCISITTHGDVVGNSLCTIVKGAAPIYQAASATLRSTTPFTFETTYNSTSADEPPGGEQPVVTTLVIVLLTVFGILICLVLILTVILRMRRRPSGSHGKQTEDAVYCDPCKSGNHNTEVATPAHSVRVVSPTQVEMFQHRSTVDSSTDGRMGDNSVKANRTELDFRVGGAVQDTREEAGLYICPERGISDGDYTMYCCINDGYLKPVV